MSLRELVFWGWWNIIIFVYTSVLLRCYFQFVLPIIEYCSPVWGQLLKVTFNFLGARCMRWKGFFPIIVSCRCVIEVVWLGLVCCTRLIRIQITVCSTSFHLLLLEFDIPELRPQLIHWSLKYHGVERPNLLDFPACSGSIVEWPSRHCVWHRNAGWIQGWSQRWLRPWVVFSLVFRGTGACGVAKAIYKQLCVSHSALYYVFVFPTNKVLSTILVKYSNGSI